MCGCNAVMRKEMSEGLRKGPVALGPLKALKGVISEVEMITTSPFIEIRPTPCTKEIIVDFKTRDIHR